MQSLTSNLIVDDIETCLTFWIDRLGFEKTVEVPEGSRLGFVILKRGDLELMLQSRASLTKDVPAIAEIRYQSVLYLRVADLTPFKAALATYPKVVEERTTDYGAREMIVHDPAGNVVFLAAHG